MRGTQDLCLEGLETAHARSVPGQTRRGSRVPVSPRPARAVAVPWHVAVCDTGAAGRGRSRSEPASVAPQPPGGERRRARAGHGSGTAGELPGTSFALPPRLSMEAIAKFAFTASGEDELSFQAGDMLKILSSQEEWYKAELRSHEGYVPKNFIDFHVPPWFDENISRHEAENLLMSKGVGCFIVRASQNSHGDFSISVRHEDDVQHFKVMRDSKGSYYLWTEKFHSLNKLVDYYRTTSISRQKQIFLRDNSQEEKERRGGSLERIGREGFHVGGAAGEDHSSISTRYLEHPVPILQQQQERYGGSLDRNDMMHRLRDHGQGSAGAMQRRHTDPLHQQTPRTLWVRALYDFDALEHDELGFRTGDILEVLDSSNPSWWKGRLRGELGLFPANYVTPVLL